MCVCAHESGGGGGEVVGRGGMAEVRAEFSLLVKNRINELVTISSLCPSSEEGTTRMSVPYYARIIITLSRSGDPQGN